MQKLFLICTLSLFFFFTATAQENCAVKLQEISGTYTGACKDGKANGKGKSVGIDQYEGNFKNGYPDGEGTYTWSNGDVYTGGFRKGLKEGKGSMLLHKDSASGKATTGYWKKNVYIGEYETDYKVLSFTSEVARVNVEANPGKGDNNIRVLVASTTANGRTITNVENSHLRLTDIRISKGTFQTRVDNSKYKDEEAIFKEVEFPFRAVFYVDNNSVEVEFFNPGSYTLNIFINK